MSAEGHDHGHDHEHEHHHKDTPLLNISLVLIKMIATILDFRYYDGYHRCWYALFRMQLAWPEESFKIFNVLLGDKCPNGIMTNDIYLSLSHDTRYHNGFLCFNSVKRYF
jgi:cytochrome c oxidase subunit 1